MRQQIEHWLAAFALDESVQSHALEVLVSLPTPIREDFLSDPRFTICDYEPGVGVVMQIPLRPPGKTGSRAVVLKRTLRNRPTDFVRWLIAHELAHAHLRHAGRFPGEDPEVAADALAAEWGFPKPPRQKW